VPARVSGFESPLRHHTFSCSYIATLSERTAAFDWLVLVPVPLADWAERVSLRESFNRRKARGEGSASTARKGDRHLRDFMGTVIPPGLAKQVSIPIATRGFRTWGTGKSHLPSTCGTRRHALDEEHSSSPPSRCFVRTKFRDRRRP
jgi:hypothetical protein